MGKLSGAVRGDGREEVIGEAARAVWGVGGVVGEEEEGEGVEGRVVGEEGGEGGDQRGGGDGGKSEGEGGAAGAAEGEPPAGDESDSTWGRRWEAREDLLEQLVTEDFIHVGAQLKLLSPLGASSLLQLMLLLLSGERISKRSSPSLAFGEVEAERERESGAWMTLSGW